MIRYSVLLLNMLGFFVYQLFFTDGVTVSQTVPASMSPGNDYTIELTVNKGSIGGFAKLQQDLPAGCTATPVESKGASFTMSGNSVKFIWTSLPSDASFTISYKVSVSSTAAPGSNVLGGKFYYVLDNLKQSVVIPESNFSIVSGAVATTSAPDTSSATVTPPATATTTPVATTPPPATTPPATTATTTPAGITQPETTPPATAVTPPPATTTASSGDGGLGITRKIIANASADYTVEVTINRGKTTGFAKLQENIPAGFSASALQSNGASFNFSDQKVKLVWINLPGDDQIKVSYKLTGSGGPASIDGLFSYIENEETKKYPISATVIEGSTPATAIVVPPATIATVTAPTPATTTNPETAVTPKVPSAQTAVKYKVQVCALRQSPVDVSYFSSHYGLAVGQELHEGWTKYTVNGGFNEYKPARDYREVVRGKGVVNPFVTAYNSGKRITVQEALMITSQKWYP